jgi:hypothetical protein
MAENKMLAPPYWIIGLDLGQAQDYSALCGLERYLVADDEGKAVKLYACKLLHRWPLGTPYTTVIEDVGKIVARLKQPPLVVDGTGAGRPIIDMIRAAQLPVCMLRPVVITGGHACTYEEGWARVPKRDLVGAVQSALQSRRLRISGQLPEAQTLVKELQTFRVKINISTGNESFESWRERDHDDLVFSVALAVWQGERSACCITMPSVSGPAPRARREEYPSMAVIGSKMGGSDYVSMSDLALRMGGQRPRPRSPGPEDWEHPGGMPY